MSNKIQETVVPRLEYHPFQMDQQTPYEVGYLPESTENGERNCYPCDLIDGLFMPLRSFHIVFS